MSEAQTITHHGDNVVIHATKECEKTAGRSVVLPARRRQSWVKSMYKSEREGHSPYDCGIEYDQQQVFSVGGGR